MVDKTAWDEDDPMRGDGVSNSGDIIRAVGAGVDRSHGSAAIMRLARLLNAEIDALEAMLESGDRCDPEKRARTLGALARAAEKLDELTRERTARDDRSDPPDRDAVLAELERRFDRLIAGGDAAPPDDRLGGGGA